VKNVRFAGLDVHADKLRNGLNIFAHPNQRVPTNIHDIVDVYLAFRAALLGNQASQRLRRPHRIASATAFAYDARPLQTAHMEVSHATQERTPRHRVLSRSPVSAGKASHRRCGSNEEHELSVATRSSARSSVAVIRVPAFQAGDFKNC
jgi:hypothetical protein